MFSLWSCSCISELIVQHIYQEPQQCSDSLSCSQIGNLSCGKPYKVTWHSICVFVCVCVGHLCVCVGMCGTFVCLCGYVWGICVSVGIVCVWGCGRTMHAHVEARVGTECLLLSWDRVWSLSPALLTSWMAREVPGSLLPPPAAQGYWCVPSLWCWFWESNLHPHACAARALPTEPSPQPHNTVKILQK